MPAVPFAQLPDHARLWIFPAARKLRPHEAETLLAAVDRFIERWAAHGHPVVGGRVLSDDRFLMVAADERATGVSGCSTDTLFHAIAAAEREIGVPLRDSSLVFWRDDRGEIQAAPRPDFRQRVAEGSVAPETVVFDHTVATLGDVRQGAWETRFSRAWHARAFPLPAPR